MKTQELIQYLRDAINMSRTEVQTIDGRQINILVPVFTGLQLEDLKNKLHELLMLTEISE